MTNSEHPCSKGLSAACFAAYPVWAKQMFAWRLFTTLAPPALSRRLQKMLGIKAVFPGVDIPPGVILPPGTVVPPGVDVPEFWNPGDPIPAGIWYPAIAWEFPPGWDPGDSLPPGVEMAPGTVFPDGWQVGWPLPDGITLPEGFYYPPCIVPDNVLPPGTIVPAGTVFPDDWSYGDPLPDGVILPADTCFPPGWSVGDPIPDGVILAPGAAFPDGWTYGDPLPDGATLSDGAFYAPDWTPDISIPYNFSIDPGTVFPDGWTYGDPLPDGVSLPSGMIYSPPSASAPPIFFTAFPPGRPNAAGSISAPSGEWATAFDDTFWYGDPFPPGSTSYYNGAATPPYWASFDMFTDLAIHPLGAWATGYRPSQVRLTNNLPMYPMWYVLYDTGMNVIATYEGITSPKTLDCDFSNNLDIYSLFARILDHDIQIRIWNIEFFS